MFGPSGIKNSFNSDVKKSIRDRIEIKKADIMDKMSSAPTGGTPLSESFSLQYLRRARLYFETDTNDNFWSSESNYKMKIEFDAMNQFLEGSGSCDLCTIGTDLETVCTEKEQACSDKLNTWEFGKPTNTATIDVAYYPWVSQAKMDSDINSAYLQVYWASMNNYNLRINSYNENLWLKFSDTSIFALEDKTFLQYMQKKEIINGNTADANICKCDDGGSNNEDEDDDYATILGKC